MPRGRLDDGHVPGAHRPGQLGGVRTVEAREVQPQGVAPGERLGHERRRHRPAPGARAGSPTTSEPGVGGQHVEHVAQGAQRGLVGPVEVVEHDEDRVSRRRGEQRVGDPVGGLERQPRGALAGDLRLHQVGQRGAAAELARAPAATATAAARRRPASSGRGRRRTPRRRRTPDALQQPGLADPGLADEQRGAGLSRVAACSTSSGEGGLLGPVARRRWTWCGRRRGDRGRRPGAAAGERRSSPASCRRIACSSVWSSGPGSSPSSSASTLAHLAQRRQGVGLAAGAGQGDGVQGPPALLKRVGRDGRLGDRQQSGVLADGQQAEHPSLLGRQRAAGPAPHARRRRRGGRRGRRTAAPSTHPRAASSVSTYAATSARSGQPAGVARAQLGGERGERRSSPGVRRRRSACTSTSAGSTRSTYPWSVVSSTPPAPARGATRRRCRRAARRAAPAAARRPRRGRPGGRRRPDDRARATSAATIDRGLRAPASTHRRSPSSAASSTRDAPNTPTRTGTT